MNEQKKTTNKTKNLVLTAVYAAIIYIFTAYIHIPHWTGYIHIGDGVLYLAASMLPGGYAAAAGAIGAGLADVFSGYAIWAPGTVVIKTATALCFTAKNERLMCRRNYIALLPSLVICTGGYYLYDALVTGNSVAALAGIPGYIIQVALSAAFYVIIGNMFDRMNLKSRIIKND